MGSEGVAVDFQTNNRKLFLRASIDRVKRDWEIIADNLSRDSLDTPPSIFLSSG
jgi:hypothetical protein